MNYLRKRLLNLTIKILVLSLMLGISRIGFTNSYFTSQATISGNQISTGAWQEEDAPGSVVINEVYYDVAGDKGTENKNEWIELYNNSDNPVSLKNWKLVDGAGNVKTINPEVSIPAKGFAVLSHDNSTWSLYWSLPSEAVTINLTGSSAWLNNDGDKLILKDDEDNEIDWVAWENYVTGWNLNAPEGHSISRKVKGVDTDSPSDWIDTYSESTPPGPNPGTNPHASIAAKDPQVSLTQSGDKRSVSFKVSDIKNFMKLSYQLTYETDTIPDGVNGEVLLHGQNTFNENNITLGTCSSGGTCTYYTGVKNINLEVILEDADGKTSTISTSL